MISTETDGTQVAKTTTTTTTNTVERKEEKRKGERESRKEERKRSQRNVGATVTLVIQLLSSTPGKDSTGEQT